MKKPILRNFAARSPLLGKGGVHGPSRSAQRRAARLDLREEAEDAWEALHERAPPSPELEAARPRQRQGTARSPSHFRGSGRGRVVPSQPHFAHAHALFGIAAQQPLEKIRIAPMD